MPIRKKYRRAIMRGTMVMCERTGQVRIPPLAISGYDEKKNPYRGRQWICLSWVQCMIA
ncbi:unnamed protein product [Effrenium voratum]|nr:unnamed protein product [Effrenium voratum]